MNTSNTLPSDVINSMPGSIVGVARRGAVAHGAILSILVRHDAPDGKAAGYSIHTPDGKKTQSMHLAETGRIEQAKDQHSCKA